MNWIKWARLKGSLVRKTVPVALGLALIASVILPGLPARAAEVTFDDALNQALLKNSQVLSLQEQLAARQRDVQKNDARMGFQFGMTGNASLHWLGENDPTKIKLNGEDQYKQGQIGISGSKTFPFGLNLQSSLALGESGLNQYTNFKDRLSVQLSANQTLFPLAPIQTVRDKYSAKNRLTKSELTYQAQLGSLKIDWLEKYLNLVRLHEQVQIAEERQKMAEDQLARVLKKAQIGEAGEQQVLLAKISASQAGLNLTKTRNDLAVQQKSFYQTMALADNTMLALTAEPAFLSAVQAKLASFQTTALNSKEEMLKTLQENNPDLQARRLDRQEAVQKYQWDLTAILPEVKLNAGYNFQGVTKSEDWNIGLSLKYTFWDGGQSKLLNQDYLVNLNSLAREEESLLDQLSLQLESYLNQLQLAKLSLEEKQLAGQKATLEAEFAQRQLAQGLLTEADYQAKILDKADAALSLKSAEDQLLVAKLRLAHFLGMDI